MDKTATRKLSTPQWFQITEAGYQRTGIPVGTVVYAVEVLTTSCGDVAKSVYSENGKRLGGSVNIDNNNGNDDPPALKPILNLKGEAKMAEPKTIWEKICSNYYMSKAEYHNDMYRLKQEFQDDALRELGLKGHPKADLLFQKAWDHGRSGGYHEIWMWMQDLADLLK